MSADDLLAWTDGWREPGPLIGTRAGRRRLRHRRRPGAAALPRSAPPAGVDRARGGGDAPRRAPTAIPVPEVFDADGGDLVMERLDGVTMLDDLGARPVARRPPRRHVGRAAPAAGRRARSATSATPGCRRASARRRRSLHLDFHPDNIMLTADGPVVFDWTNAAARPAGGRRRPWRGSSPRRARSTAPWWLRADRRSAAPPARRPLRRRLRPGRGDRHAARRRRLPPRRPQRPPRGSGRIRALVASPPSERRASER